MNEKDKDEMLSSSDYKEIANKASGYDKMNLRDSLELFKELGTGPQKVRMASKAIITIHSNNKKNVHLEPRLQSDSNSLDERNKRLQEILSKEIKSIPNPYAKENEWAPAAESSISNPYAKENKWDPDAPSSIPNPFAKENKWDPGADTSVPNPYAEENEWDPDAPSSIPNPYEESRNWIPKDIKTDAEWRAGKRRWLSSIGKVNDMNMKGINTNVEQEESPLKENLEIKRMSILETKQKVRNGEKKIVNYGKEKGKEKDKEEERDKLLEIKEFEEKRKYVGKGSERASIVGSLEGEEKVKMKPRDTEEKKRDLKK